MDRHTIPRQITTFEFKLIGFLSIKQFIYLVVFGGASAVVFLTVPVPFLNIILSILTGLAGAMFAFFKYNERTLDAWIKNLFVRLLAPSQYYYIKQNQAPYFLKNIGVSTDPILTQTHIDANKKLSSYISKSGQTLQTEEKKQEISKLIHEIKLQKRNPPPKQQVDKITKAPFNNDQLSKNQIKKNLPFYSGVVKNNKDLPLPNILIYIKNSSGEVLRILKTNHHGVFATFSSLSPGSYVLEIKDLGGKFNFDTMDVIIEKNNNSPVTIYSKELL